MILIVNEYQPFLASDFTLFYVPMGLEAAMTVHLACSEVTMPALEMEMLCCSMASWILVLSASFIWRTA